MRVGRETYAGAPHMHGIFIAQTVSCHQRATIVYSGVINVVQSQAHIIVYSIPDHHATEQSVRLARTLSPDIYIMVKTRFSSQVDELNKAGANQVIPEEFETSIEIFSRVLREFRMPNNIIEQQVELVRL